jgi:hypothetical protein
LTLILTSTFDHELQGPLGIKFDRGRDARSAKHIDSYQMIRSFGVIASEAINSEFAPENLLGLMWLQMAETINNENPQVRQCAACKTWMLISHETVGNRSGRLTCSHTCRTKLYTERKAEARKLQASGLSVKGIAKCLSAEPSKVRSWIAEEEITVVRLKRPLLESEVVV